MYFRAIALALIASSVSLVSAYTGDGKHSNELKFGDYVIDSTRRNVLWTRFVRFLQALATEAYHRNILLGLGACGITNTDSDPIVAVGYQTFDSYPCVINRLILEVTNRFNVGRGATANPNK